MTNQTVLVTGAASGIGLGAAKMLAARGANVLAFDINADLLKSAHADGPENIQTFPGDVSDAASCAEAVAAAVNAFGGLNAVQHWGAIHSSATWQDLGPDEMSRILSVNVIGSFLISQAAGRQMAKQGGGAIVLTTSGSVIAGASGGQGQGGPAYVSSKGAVIALMRSLARGMSADNIRVNAVAPGVTETPMIANYKPEQREWSEARVPLGRIGTPEEIAAAGCFLISDEASYITGQTLHVNGGASFN